MLEITMTGHVGSCKFVAAPNKSPVLNINVACNRRVGEQEYTDWVSAKVWGDRATKLKDHVTKGQRLLLKGRPEARGYKAPDGTPKAELVLHVAELEFLSAKGKTDPGDAPEHAEAEDAELPLATA
jgi:single-stranded DNA-binding protein